MEKIKLLKEECQKSQSPELETAWDSLFSSALNFQPKFHLHGVRKEQKQTPSEEEKMEYAKTKRKFQRARRTFLQLARHILTEKNVEDKEVTVTNVCNTS